VTNFEKRWAWFFMLLGWQWEYFPAKHGFNVQPAFRVRIPCENSECNGAHDLDVFLRRGIRDITAFGVSIYDLAASRKNGDSPYNSPHPALFGDNPSVSIWEMAHGHGGGEYCIPYWESDWQRAWRQARSLTITSVLLPIGRLR